MSNDKHERKSSRSSDDMKRKTQPAAGAENTQPPLGPASTQQRRPLPNPQTPQAIPADQFYAASSSSRTSRTPGSSRTGFILPDFPVQRSPSPPPPLITPDVAMYDDSNPPLYQPAGSSSGWDATVAASWGEPDVAATPWDNAASFQGIGDSWGLSTSSKVQIDGRDMEEETSWSDAQLRAKRKRPGPGMLPPLLADLLHNPEHTLHSVTATPSLPPSRGHSSSSSTSSLASVALSTQNTYPPASADEVRMAIPHPNAYYCKEHHGWVLIAWCASSVLPQLARSFTPTTPFPDQARRRRTASCLGNDDQPSSQANKTHHFHRYHRAVDARLLTTPYKRSDWEVDELRKRRRRKMTLHEESASASAEPPADDEPEGDLLDLYVCCQCSVYCLSSDVIPGVVPVKFLEELVKDKLSHPSLGRTPNATALTALETCVTICENRLFRGESRVLPVTGDKFTKKIAWSPTVRAIFDHVGFTAKDAPSSKPEAPAVLALHPPDVHPSTPEGRRARAKLLRGWVELAAYTTFFAKSKPKESFGTHEIQQLTVKIESAREMYQTGIGAHVSQIPRGLLPHSLTQFSELDAVWKGFGMTPSSYSPDLLLFAYFAQCRCDPANTTQYYHLLRQVFDTMKIVGVQPPEELELVLAEEKARGRFTTSDLQDAVRALGFGRENELGVELDEDVEDEFIVKAWKDAMKRTWRLPEADTSQKRMELTDAFKVVADARGSQTLLEAWKEGKKNTGMSPDAAYSTLEVPSDVDEEMLITVYNFRVEDAPGQLEKMKEALSVIADVRDSQRLRQFLETGQDPGDVSQQVGTDMPRGLNQLGNTCYLNSLLQYFYTIKDLREAVTPLANPNAKSVDDKLSDDDLKRHRVGGRLVTRREIQRSKKFVHQLAELFWNLEYCEVPAVTPTIDLAKLALVTSQDEEEEDQDRPGTDTSNDTDATLVDDGPAPSHARTYSRSKSASPIVESPTAESGSVLGKRSRRNTQSMDVDVVADTDAEGPNAGENGENDSFVIVSQPSGLKGKSGGKEKHKDQDVEMLEVAPSSVKIQAPALPPRKPREVNDSVMMFGRQHDVSECMDNCMFQIETALLDFQEMTGSEDDKTSVVKRLFYGKKRQRLAPLGTTEDRLSRYSIHEKEDLFSHLHVNVSEEGYDLYDGLSRYFDDVVEFEGIKRHMEVSLVDLPPLLQIQLQRVQFDRETQQAYKSQAYVKFGETIYLDRFMDSVAPEKKARAKDIQGQLNACRDRILKLTQGKHAPFAPALGGVADFLEKQEALQLEEVDDDFISIVRSEGDHIAANLEHERAEAIKLKEELENVWKDDKSAAYELTSVFIHRGSSPSWGHYFFYSRHLPDKPDSWFKYNDSDVSVISKEEVLADTTGSTANPYMLVFTRKDLDIIHTVHRFDAEQLLDS